MLQKEKVEGGVLFYESVKADPIVGPIILLEPATDCYFGGAYAIRVFFVANSK
jgi:hypothetical protein